MREIWKDIPGFGGRYRISNQGNVMSMNYLGTGKPKLLKAKKHHSGYLTVRLCYGDGRPQKNRTIHSLVAESFIPKKPNSTCVNHIDGNKHNNCADNLEWVTFKENINHAIRTGLKNPHYNNHPSGSNTPNSRCVYQYSKDGTFIKKWDCISDAARFYGMNPCMITNNASHRTLSAKGFVWEYNQII